MNNVYFYILGMALVTYIIRVLPLTLIRKKIKNRIIRSFLYYVPYVTLAVMTFPAILDATQSVWSALAAFLVALALAYFFGSACCGENFLFVITKLTEVCFRKKFCVTAKHNVRSSSRHIGGNGNGAVFACLCYDFRFLCVIFRIKHVMLYTLARKKL